MQSMSSGLPYASDANLRAIRETVQEVGKLAVASQGLFGAMRAGIAAVQGQVASFVALANPAAFQKFKLAVDDLHGVIGRVLLPVLNNFTTVIQKIADYFHALSPAAKSMIAGLTAAAVSFTVVTVAVWAMNTAIGILTGGMSTAIGAIVSMAAGFIFAASGTDSIRKGMDSILGPLSQVLNMFGQLAGRLAEELAPMIETVFTAVAVGLKVMLDILTPFQPIIITIGKLFASLATVAAQVLIALSPLLIAMNNAMIEPLLSLLPMLEAFASVTQRLAVYIAALTEMFLEWLGMGKKEQEIPGRAPPAVRQSQIGDMGSFISRQYVNSFNGGSPEQKRENIMKGMAEDVKKARIEIEKVVKGIEVVANILTSPAKTAYDVGKKAVERGAGAAEGMIPGVWAARQAWRAITG